MECEECGDIGTRCEGTGELCPDCYDDSTSDKNIYPQWLYLKLLEKEGKQKEMEEEVVCECISHNEENWRENCDLVEKIVRKGANKEGEDWLV